MTNLISTVILNIAKDTLTLIGLIGVMFYQNWRLALIALIMIPLASFAAKKLGKRIGKVTTQAQELRIADLLYARFFKNHKVIKIFQRENYEFIRAEKFINDLKEKSIKIATVWLLDLSNYGNFNRYNDRSFNIFFRKLILNDQLDVNNFFSFLAAMMLAYQPVKSLATINMAINQGLSAARRILPINRY